MRVAERDEEPVQQPGNEALRMNGGEEDNLTLGLNWLPNVNLRLSANYTRYWR